MATTVTRTAKKAIAQIMCITLFCTFPCRHCTTATQNLLISRFMEEVNTRQLFLFLFVNLETVLQNSAPEKIANLCQIKGVGVRAIKFETARIHSLGDVQSLLLPWARFEGEGRACVLLSRAIAHLAPHISYGLATRANSLSYDLGRKHIIYDIVFSMFVQLNTRT